MRQILNDKIQQTTDDRKHQIRELELLRDKLLTQEAEAYNAIKSLNKTADDYARRGTKFGYGAALVQWHQKARDLQDMLQLVDQELDALAREHKYVTRSPLAAQLSALR
ncbi:MAG TPA: hypothetical protein VNR20_03300 [Terriglobales bacterium]|nr:hypothetical protein [Terriglobales bacterium]